MPRIAVMKTAHAFVVSNLLLLLLLLLLACSNTNTYNSIWRRSASVVDAFTTTFYRTYRLRQRSTPSTTTTTALFDTEELSSEKNNMEDDQRRRRQAFLKTAVPGPSLDTKPDYESIVGPLGKFVDNVFQQVFRDELALQVVGEGNATAGIPDGYAGIVELAARMNREFAHNRTEIHVRAQTVLRNLFPSWMPGSYAVLFSKPFPGFSSRMNAWATGVGGTWLMGECEINDVEIDGGEIGVGQGLLVKRCRFLEESGCASVCVNSCKIPTQNFFLQDMGLPLTMEPDYETYECQFSFGRTPDATTEFVAQSTPCLQRCPTAGSLRRSHDTGSGIIEEDPKCPFLDDPTTSSSESTSEVVIP
eukprot:scaffold4947_cov160-Amphora_coffeaeformis.AAC.3